MRDGFSEINVFTVAGRSFRTEDSYKHPHKTILEGGICLLIRALKGDSDKIIQFVYKGAEYYIYVGFYTAREIRNRCHNAGDRVGLDFLSYIFEGFPSDANFYQVLQTQKHKVTNKAQRSGLGSLLDYLSKLGGSRVVPIAPAVSNIPKPVVAPVAPRKPVVAPKPPAPPKPVVAPKPPAVSEKTPSNEIVVHDFIFSWYRKLYNERPWLTIFGTTIAAGVALYAIKKVYDYFYSTPDLPSSDSLPSSSLESEESSESDDADSESSIAQFQRPTFSAATDLSMSSSSCSSEENQRKTISLTEFERKLNLLAEDAVTQKNNDVIQSTDVVSSSSSSSSSSDSEAPSESDNVGSTSSITQLQQPLLSFSTADTLTSSSSEEGPPETGIEARSNDPAQVAVAQKNNGAGQLNNNYVFFHRSDGSRVIRGNGCFGDYLSEAKRVRQEGGDRRQQAAAQNIVRRK